MGYGGNGKSYKGKGKGKRGESYWGVRRTIKGTGSRGKGKGKRKGKGKGKGKSQQDLDRQLDEYMGPDAMKLKLNSELDTYMGAAPEVVDLDKKKENGAAPEAKAAKASA